MLSLPEKTNAKPMNEVVTEWFHTTVSPQFQGGTVPSWSWVLDMAERHFDRDFASAMDDTTKQIHDVLRNLYRQAEEDDEE